MKTIVLLAIITLLNIHQQENIPQEVYNLAPRGSKVYIISQDENAVVHLKNAMESWGYWKTTENKKEADFILKVFLRFEGAGVCIANATFVKPKTDDVVYSTQEVTSVKKASGFDFNTKRSAMRQLVEVVFKPNFK